MIKDFVLTLKLASTALLMVLSMVSAFLWVIAACCFAYDPIKNVILWENAWVVADLIGGAVLSVVAVAAFATTHDRLCGVSVAREFSKESAELSRLRGENDELADALENLMDWQNGPPLSTPRYVKGWGEAMKQAEAAIAHRQEGR